MKKYDKKEFLQKANSLIQKKKSLSIDKNFHGKMNNLIYQKSSDNMEYKNQNITNINNISIINMIMSKEKSCKYKNISIYSQDHSHNNKKTIKKNKINNKRNNTSLLIDYKRKINYSTISKDDMSKSKTNKLLLYSPYDHSKFIQNIKKKNSLIKIKQKNRSCRQLSNIKINLYNNKFIDKNRQKNYFISDDEHSSSLNQKSDFIKIEGRIRKKINPKELEGNSKMQKILI